MVQLCPTIFKLAWGLGVLSLLAGAVLRVLGNWPASFKATPRGGLIFAATPFLCALATREMERTGLRPS